MSRRYTRCPSGPSYREQAAAEEARLLMHLRTLIEHPNMAHRDQQVRLVTNKLWHLAGVDVWQ